MSDAKERAVPPEAVEAVLECALEEAVAPLGDELLSVALDSAIYDGIQRDPPDELMTASEDAEWRRFLTPVIRAALDAARRRVLAHSDVLLSAVLESGALVSRSEFERVLTEMRDSSLRQAEVLGTEYAEMAEAARYTRDAATIDRCLTALSRLASHLPESEDTR